MKKYLKHLTGVILVLTAAFLLGACGSPASTSSSTNGGGGGGTTPGLVDHGIDTTTKAHSTWTLTAPHDSYTCTDCHSVNREQICAQSTCHPFSKYSSLATNFNHTTAGTGEQCNKCHGMTPYPTATDAVRIAGWRQNVKAQISDTIWHPDLKGVCTDCHDAVKHDPLNNLSNFPASHVTDTTRQKDCQNCHYYKLNTAGTAGTWGGAAHPAETTGCATATCHTHTKSTTETHYQGGTAPAGQHYDVNTGGPFNCEWCHAETITNNYTSWAVAFDKATHQNWNSSSCAACHPGGTHPAVTSGCRTATCHTHTKPTTQNKGPESGHHYDANAGGSMGAGPFECEWCHQNVATNGYTSWSLTFNKHNHQQWNYQSCGACHPNSIPN